MKSRTVKLWAMDREGSGMGKRKETFKVWRKPKSKGNVETQSRNAGKAPQSITPKANKTLNFVNGRRGTTEKPKGMKNTSSSKPSMQDVLAMHMNIEGLEVQGGRSKVFRNESAIDMDFRTKEVSEKASVRGRKPRIEESDLEIDEGKSSNTPDTVAAKEGTQRRGKEIAHSKSLAAVRKFEEFLSSEGFSNHGGKGHRTARRRRLHFSEYEEGTSNSGDVGQKSSKSRRSQKSSNSEFESLVKVQRENYQSHREFEGRREGRRKQSGSGENRMVVLNESSDSEDYNPREEEVQGLHKSLQRSQHASGKREQKRHRNRDFSEDEYSSGSSGKMDWYRHENAKEKIVKIEKAERGTPKIESQKRRGRRHREGEKESQRRQREQQGFKGHYIMVDYKGEPYGPGVGAWRLELNKLSASLDPSITNIRHQPEEAMSTLRRRLKEHFEYSSPVDRAHIWKLAGKFVTQRRSRILSSMKNGGSRPVGMDSHIWRRLDRLCQDPHREQLCQRMKFANAARINLGRTGPRGEEGIRVDLYRQLGREPDPQEVQEEMRRPKGYTGVSSRGKALREYVPCSVEGGKNVLDGTNNEEEQEDNNNGRCSSCKPACASEEIVMYDLSYVRKMQVELEMLRAKMGINPSVVGIETMQNAGPSTSIRVGEQESNFTMPPEDSSVAAVGEEATENQEEEDLNAQQKTRKKLRRSRK